MTRRTDSDAARALTDIGADLVAADLESKRDVEEYLLARGLAATFVRPVFFMDNFAQFMTPSIEDGTLVVRIPLPAGIPLQMIAGDELTGEQMAAAYQRRYHLPARYEPVPLDVLGGDADQRAMFEWFAHPPAFRADFAATRALAPRTKTFDQWLTTQLEQRA